MTQAALPNLFVINTVGDVLIEKHFYGAEKRTVCDVFWEEVQKCATQKDVAPIICTPHYYLVNVRRFGLFFLTTARDDVLPIVQLETIQMIVNTLLVYFGDSLSDATFRENFALIYQILDELVDGGLASTTELNQLTEMIAPSTWKPSMFASKQIDDALPQSVVSKTPWRRTGMKYMTNEIYVDIVEEIDAIVGANAQLISSEVNGRVECRCDLSGMPDLTLVFNNSKVVDNVQLHRCVRISRWERENTISFVPPDGKFTLMAFRCSNMSNQLPLYVTPRLKLKAGRTPVHVTVEARLTKAEAEKVYLELPFPRSALSFNLTANVGQVVPDDITKKVRWNIGKIGDTLPTLEGTVAMPSDFDADIRPTLKLGFLIKQHSTTGLKVQTLNISRVDYKPYKGARSITRGVSFLIRT